MIGEPAFLLLAFCASCAFCGPFPRNFARLGVLEVYHETLVPCAIARFTRFGIWSA